MQEPIDLSKVSTLTPRAQAKVDELIATVIADAGSDEEQFAVLFTLQSAAVAWLARLGGAELVAGQLVGQSQALLESKGDLANPRRH